MRKERKNEGKGGNRGKGREKLKGWEEEKGDFGTHRIPNKTQAEKLGCIYIYIFIYCHTPVSGVCFLRFLVLSLTVSQPTPCSWVF